jgi:hypothetical protein
MFYANLAGYGYPPTVLGRHGGASEWQDYTDNLPAAKDGKLSTALSLPVPAHWTALPVQWAPTPITIENMNGIPGT